MGWELSGKMMLGVNEPLSKCWSRLLSKATNSVHAISCISFDARQTYVSAHSAPLNTGGLTSQIDFLVGNAAAEDISNAGYKETLGREPQ